MASRKEKRAAARKKAAVEKKTKEVKLTPVPKRIRINFLGANSKRSFSPGDVLRVPEDVPEDSARTWLNSGAAVEDKSLPDPPEVKDEPETE
jgi:hypothetical protein